MHLVKKVVEDKGGKFSCLLDYYYMKGYLHQMAGAVKDWTKKQRTQWIRKMTKFLFEGNNASFEKEVEKLRNRSGNHLLHRSNRYGKMGDCAPLFWANDLFHL